MTLTNFYERKTSVYKDLAKYIINLRFFKNSKQYIYFCLIIQLKFLNSILVTVFS